MKLLFMKNKIYQIYDEAKNVAVFFVPLYYTSLNIKIRKMIMLLENQILLMD